MIVWREEKDIQYSVLDLWLSHIAMWVGREARKALILFGIKKILYLNH